MGTFCWVLFVENFLLVTFCLELFIGNFWCYSIMHVLNLSSPAGGG
jgi:hypothetical protein